VSSPNNRSRDYYWRLAATGFCFLTFGLGVVVACLALLPLELAVGDREKKQKTARRLIRTMFRGFVRLMRSTGALIVRVDGEERLQRPDSKLVVANHPTLIDVVILLSLIPDAVCIVKAELEGSLFIRFLLRRTGYITNSSAETLLGGCAEVFARGGSVLVFPEGTRSVPGRPLKFLRGAAQIALRCRKDLTPVVITCRPPALLKGQKWYQVPAKEPVSMRFTTGSDIPIDGFLAPNEGISLASRKLTRHLTDYFHRLLSQTDTGH